MNQKGFATLEVILMITVIGILAAVAVPRFTDVTAKANTAKIQADLSTLDSAIAIYYMENGKYPADGDLTPLSPYVQDVGNLEPPTGEAFINGSATDIPTGGYKIGTSGDAKRAMLGSYTVKDFSKNTSNSTNNSGSTSSDS